MEIISSSSSPEFDAYCIVGAFVIFFLCPKELIKKIMHTLKCKNKLINKIERSIFGSIGWYALLLSETGWDQIRRAVMTKKCISNVGARK